LWSSLKATLNVFQTNALPSVVPYPYSPILAALKPILTHIGRERP
jgi:hypothetical protein